MARPEKIEKTVTEEPIIAETQEKQSIEDIGLPDKDLFRIDEVARYFSVSERTIWLWIQHGKLQTKKMVGSTRVLKDSILKWRFNARLPVA